MTPEVPVRAIVAVLGLTALFLCMVAWYVRTFHPSLSLLRGAFGRPARTHPLASQATDAWTTERTLTWMRSTHDHGAADASGTRSAVDAMARVNESL